MSRATDEAWAQVMAASPAVFTQRLREAMEGTARDVAREVGEGLRDDVNVVLKAMQHQIGLVQASLRDEDLQVEQEREGVDGEVVDTRSNTVTVHCWPGHDFRFEDRVRITRGWGDESEQGAPAPEPDPVKALYRIAQGVQDPAGAARHTLLCMGEEAPGAPAPSEDTEGEVPVAYAPKELLQMRWRYTSSPVHRVAGGDFTIPLYSHETVQRLQRENKKLAIEARALRDGLHAEKHRYPGRWNIQATDTGVRICKGGHRNGSPCEWEEYVGPAPESEGESDDTAS